MTGSLSIEHHTNTGRAFVLEGANADLWSIATSAPRLRMFGARLDTLAEALAAMQDSERVAASKLLIREIWSLWPVLGPYPFIDTLSNFEFSRVFHDKYRDHVCHQLKVFILGLGVFDNCPQIQVGLDKFGIASDFDRTWAVTSVFHDVGYVIEANDSQPGQKQWNDVREEYKRVMEAPFSTTGIFSNGREQEKALAADLSMRKLELSELSKLAAPGVFSRFEDEAKRAGLAGQKVNGSAIQAYYEYAQKIAPKGRPGFRDHGVASALLLMEHWSRYDDYINGWIKNQGALEDNYSPTLDLFPKLKALQLERNHFFPLLCRAAGAMSIHNITPEIWENQFSDAFSAGVGFQSFRIRFADNGKNATANPLSFLLGLIDTLQDWDRPAFEDSPNANALHGGDLSIRPKDGKVYVYIRADDEEFRNPETSLRSRYSRMCGVLTSYLDKEVITDLVKWGAEAQRQAIGSIGAMAPYVQTSKLGQRLRVSELEKSVIARHCAASDFWRADDTVFIEAGTLPVYMVFELYRERGERARPLKIITNNLACALLTVMDQPAGSSSRATFPEDEPSNLFVLGGRVINDYAGTIPGGRNEMSQGNEELWAEDICGSHDDIQRCLEAAGVNHVVMMVTRLDVTRGPCAASEWMRRYKKRLLQYVATHQNVRLSILGEADKLYRRDGEPADEIDDGKRYWPGLLEAKLVSVVCARSHGIEEDYLERIKDSLRKLEKRKANVTLLGPGGIPESIDARPFGKGTS